MRNSERVLEIIRIIESNDRQAILDCFHEDAIFHNIPMPVARGHEEIWQTLAPVHEHCTDIRWEIHHIAEDAQGRVLTERTDRYRLGERWAEFKVMGIFELENNKIRHWRDYFDLQQSLASMAACR
jgi:limonene-1,2-epoxide hydrolase